MGTADAQGAGSQRFLPSPEGISLALSAARAGLWEWDIHTNQNRWSEELWPLYGLDPVLHSASYEHWLMSVHAEDRERTCALVSQAVASRQAFEIEWRTSATMGPVRWLLSRGQPGVCRDDQVQTYVGIVMDISQRKQAEQALQTLNAALAHRVQERTQALDDQQRLLQTILDGVPGLVGYWDTQLHNRFANRAYREWFGVTPQEIQGKHIRDLLGPNLYELNRGHMERALRGERQCFIRDIPVHDQPDKVRISETHYLPDIDHGEVRGFLVMVFDVTQVTQAERQARAASQAKSEFLANVSHELRTPLNAMFGLAQIGARDTAGTPSARTFQQILASGQHLLSLINDVLDFSKIEAGKLLLQAQPMALAQVMEHVVAMTALRAEAKGLPLLLEESPRVPQGAVCDATRLAQILVNLVANAIKFTDQGEVRLRFDVDALAACLVVEVSDTGIGIESQHIGQLFQPFVQAHDGVRGQGGTGLGLAICKRLTQLMQGRLDVRSEPGVGSCFTLRVPLAQSEPGDFTPLSDVLLVGFPSAAQTCLVRDLAGRHSRCQVADDLPPTLRHGQVLVVHEQLLAHLDTATLNRWLDEGRTVVISVRVAPSTPLCPAGISLRDEALVVAGPLSPLRLLHALQHRPPATKRGARNRLKGIRILAAEDNPVNRLILAQMLEGEGASVRFAFDGAQAVARAQDMGTDSIDLVLCDIQMPVMDGYEATRELLRLDPTLPIVGLTAHAFNQARQQAQEAGMRDYVTKPYLLDTLTDVIRRHARQPGPPVNDANTPPGHSLEPLSDWASMQHHFQGQPALFDRLVDVALQSLPGVLCELDRARALGDMAALAKIAHEIKGTALNLRAPRLAAIGATTQGQAREGQPSCHASASELSAGLQAFLEDLRSHGHGSAQATQPGALDALSSVNQSVRAEVAQDGRGDLLNGLVRR